MMMMMMMTYQAVLNRNTSDFILKFFTMYVGPS
jgi:hypothetical protein